MTEEENEIIDAIGQKYRGDHNIETLLLIMTRITFERLQLLEALKGLIEATREYDAAVHQAKNAVAKIKA